MQRKYFKVAYELPLRDTLDLERVRRQIKPKHCGSKKLHSNIYFQLSFGDGMGRRRMYRGPNPDTLLG